MKKSSIRSLLVFVMCSGFVWLLSSGTVVSQSKNPRIERPDNRTANRVQSIIKEVRHELVMLPYYGVFDWLEGEVKPDGPVIWRGEAVRPTMKSDAEKAVKRIESVTNVVNQIRVLPLSPMDDEQRIAIYRALFNGNSPLMQYGLRSVPPIHIIVENGRATLKGVVATEMDKQLAYTAARSVPGLFDVKNELTLEKATTS